MLMVVYTVATHFDDGGLADEWLRWFCGGHIAEVMAGGAVDAEIVEIEGTSRGRAFEVRYHFPSRQRFQDYERDHAPRLRTEGLQLFPVEKGITYRRSIGTVVDRFPAPPER